MLNSSKSMGAYWCLTISHRVQANNKRKPELQGTYRINRQDRAMLAGKSHQAGKDLSKITNTAGPLQGKCINPNSRAIPNKMYFPISVAL